MTTLDEFRDRQLTDLTDSLFSRGCLTLAERGRFRASVRTLLTRMDTDAVAAFTLVEQAEQERRPGYPAASKKIRHVSFDTGGPRGHLAAVVAPFLTSWDDAYNLLNTLTEALGADFLTAHNDVLKALADCYNAAGVKDVKALRTAADPLVKALIQLHSLEEQKAVEVRRDLGAVLTFADMLRFLEAM